MNVEGSNLRPVTDGVPRRRNNLCLVTDNEPLESSSTEAQWRASPWEPKLPYRGRWTLAA
eukprot:5050501-Pyramimonas_sp.AAC.1